MYKAEIVAGLKNTMDRGYTLEQAIQSFINAGYPKEDVIDSAEHLKREPLLAMQVTAPSLREKEKKAPIEKEKTGFFHRLHLPHIHFARHTEKEKIEQIKIMPTIAEKKPETKITSLEVTPATQKIHPEEKLRIRKIETELKTKKKEPEKPIEKKPIETTAILELPKLAPRRVKLDRKQIALEKVKVPKIVQKHEIKLPQERTELLGLPKTPRRKSENSIFIILIILLLMLLGALIFSFFYRDTLINIIKQLLGE